MHACNVLDDIDLASAIASLAPQLVVVAAEHDEASVLEADSDELAVGTDAHRTRCAHSNASQHFLHTKRETVSDFIKKSFHCWIVLFTLVGMSQTRRVPSSLADMNLA